MPFPQPNAISWKFTGKPYDLNSLLTPDQVWANLDAPPEDVRQALISLVNALNATAASASVGFSPNANVDVNANTVQTTFDALVTLLHGTGGAAWLKSVGVAGLTGDNVQALLESLKSYVDSDKVKLTTDQTIAGVKTFSSSPIVPAPTTDMQAATKKYVDDNSPVIPGSIHDQHLGNDTADIKQRFSAHLAESAKRKIYVTPEEYGAVGDGVTDDTTAILSALTYCEENNVSIAFHKNYGISQTIAINVCCYMQDKSSLIALVPLTVAVILCNGYDAVTNDRRMKDIKLAVDGNGLADTCIQLARPEHCNLTLFVKNFKTTGVDTGLQSSGNDENKIIVYYKGLDDGTSVTGLWLRGSDNDIQALYGFNAKNAVKISDGSIYSIGFLHTWVQPTLTALINASCIIFNDTFGARLHIGTAYQDTVKYLLSGTGASATNYLDINIDMYAFYTASAGLAPVVVDSGYTPSNRIYINIGEISLPQPLTATSITFEDISANPLLKVVTVKTLANLTGENSWLTNPDLIPFNIHLPVRIAGTLYDVFTTFDGVLIKQERTVTTTGEKSVRTRAYYGTWSAWVNCTSGFVTESVLTVNANTLVNTVDRNKLFRDGNVCQVNLSFTTVASLAAYASNTPFTLPAGYIPKQPIYLNVVSNRGIAFTVTITTDGVITIYPNTAIANANSVGINLAFFV